MEKKGWGRDLTEAPDPKHVLPYVLVPGSSARFFDSVIHVNNLGFRGPDIAREKGEHFRIFAIGESPTYGPTLRPNERPFPEMLQSLISARLRCNQPIEVVNAGMPAYNLQDSIERIRRDVVPLAPDLVLSYHGHNGLKKLGLWRSNGKEQLEPPRRRRASALIDEAGYRLRRTLYYSRQQATSRPEIFEPLPKNEKLDLSSRYASLYRELASLGRMHGFRVVLSTASMAVNASSPRDVIDFYKSVFREIDDTIAANAAHNRMVARIAADERIPLIDTTLALDGVWDKDLFLDIVHFTERGNELIAHTMFEELAPILIGYEGLNCFRRSQTSRLHD